MANKWTKQLMAYDDAVDYNYDSYAPENCLYTSSPYFNWIFANKSHGIPKNASVLFYSEPKAGKSLTIYNIIKQMHQDDPEGIAVFFNSEMRGQLQWNAVSGIDTDRMVVYDTNDPVKIFDRCEETLKSMLQDGMPLRIIAIDSLNAIMGVKRGNADSVSDHLMGDQALTLKNGLSKLIPFCKENGILLIGTSQLSANLEAGSYGPKEKMSASFYVRHGFEYYVSLKKAGSAEDKTDIAGKTFEDEDGLKDARGNKLLLGHKIYATLTQSSVGAAGRSGVFTLSYADGIVNQHEELFWLAKNTGILKTTNNRTYTYKDRSFNGKKETALAIKNDPALAAELLADIKALDA